MWLDKKCRRRYFFPGEGILKLSSDNYLDLKSIRATNLIILHSFQKSKIIIIFINQIQNL